VPLTEDIDLGLERRPDATSARVLVAVKRVAGVDYPFLPAAPDVVRHLD
jgi:hypothetical protein